MTLSQLEYFVAVAEEGSFTRAARRVHISQSGVSTQVRRLERDLGVELFDRRGRVVTLTAAGRAALGPARAALAAVDAVRHAVGDVTGLLRGRLVVGMVVGCTVAPLFDALARFHERHPGIELAVLEDASDRLLDRVRAGELDLALVGIAGSPPDDLDARIVVEDRLVAVVGPDHPLAGRARVSLGRLLDERLVCTPCGTGIRTALDRSASAVRGDARVVVEASAADAVVDLARRGLGVGVLSRSMTADLDGARAVPVTGAPVPALLALVWRREPGPAVQQLVAAADAAFDPRS